MMKKFFMLHIFLFFISINSIFAQRIETKYVKIINLLENKSKEEIPIEHLYANEEDANKYIRFLLSENKLDIDNYFYYSASLIDEDIKWLVLLSLDKEDKDGIIYDTFDYPLKYCFYLEKDNGKISDLYLIK